MKVGEPSLVSPVQFTSSKSEYVFFYVCLCLWRGIPTHNSVILKAIIPQVRNQTVISHCSRARGKEIEGCCGLIDSECDKTPPGLI